MKCCAKCKLVLPVQLFSKNVSRKDKVQPHCKNCYREYRKINAEIIKSKKKEYYKINAETIKINTRQYRRTNSAIIKVKKKERYKINAEAIKAMRKEYRKTNKEAVKISKQKYYKTNLGKCVARAAKYKATKRKATPKWLTVQQVKEIENFYMLANKLQKIHGIPFDVDHIVPIKAKNPITGEHVACGLHVPWNLQVLPANINRANGAKLKTQSNPITIDNHLSHKDLTNLECK